MKDKKSQTSVVVGRKNKNRQNRSEETSKRHRNTQCIKRLTRGQKLPQRLWMTPEAEDLSTSVWKQNSMIELENVKSLFPLIHNEQQRPELDAGCASESNSDQEDTAFVLMSMKKSAESLARLYVKHDTADPHIENTGLAPSEPAGKDLD